MFNRTSLISPRTETRSCRCPSRHHAENCASVAELVASEIGSPVEQAVHQYQLAQWEVSVSRRDASKIVQRLQNPGSSRNRRCLQFEHSPKGVPANSSRVLDAALAGGSKQVA